MAASGVVLFTVRNRMWQRNILHQKVGSIPGRAYDLYRIGGWCLWRVKSILYCQSWRYGKRWRVQAEETMLRALELNTQWGIPYNPSPRSHDTELRFLEEKTRWGSRVRKWSLSPMKWTINMFNTTGSPRYGDVCQSKFYETELEVDLPDPQPRTC